MRKKYLLVILCLGSIFLCSCCCQKDQNTSMITEPSKKVRDCNKPECGCEDSCACSTVCACKCNS